MESVSDKDEIPPSSMPDYIMNDSRKSNGLYGLITIPLLAILIGILIGVLRKFGCDFMVNFISRISNHMLDINVDPHEDMSIHTPFAVNEALDNISTEEYGSSSISSLSWDPRIQLEADRLSEVIADTTRLSERSLSIPSMQDHSNQSNKNLVDQQTQTSDQSIDIEADESIGIVNLDLKHPLSPMDLSPTFTADMTLESESDEDLTVSMFLNFEQNFNFQANDISDIQECNDSEEVSNSNIILSTDISDIQESNESQEVVNNNIMHSTTSSDINPNSCTRSGLVYK